MPKARTLPALAAALVLILSVPAARAASRPNPHAALECTYCHAAVPRFGVDTHETVTFWRAEADEPWLCERCHTPEQNLHPLHVIPGPERTRKPAGLPLGRSESVKDEVVCTTCHFVHAADAEHALLRGFPGDQKPFLFQSRQDFCRECHGTGLEKLSPHQGDERSCAFCHAGKPVAGGPANLTIQAAKLCAFCHGFLGEDHYAGLNPFPAPQECTGCHDPHLGKDHPARLKPGYIEPLKDVVTLNPHLKRSFCFACHTAAGGSALRTSDPVALCGRCHASGAVTGMSHPLSKVPAGYATPGGWPLTGDQLTCLTCHLPGHAADRDRPYLLRGGSPTDRNAVCFLCHKKEEWANRNPHQGAVRDKSGCEFCHALRPSWGKDTSQTVTFRAGIDILCLRCHSPQPHPVNANHTVTVKASPRVAIPQDLPLEIGNRVSCATCHNPHREKYESHLLRGSETGAGFCTKCHKI